MWRMRLKRISRSIKVGTVGNLAKVATFSFYGNKMLTCGEGGAVTLDDPQMVIRLRALRGQGMDPQRRYYFPITGYNFRLTNIACALLCAQLERSKQIVARRKMIFTKYQEQLAGIPGIRFQPTASWAESAPWLFSITVEGKEYGHSRDELMDLLAKEGIETRPFFMSLHHLPPFREKSSQRGEHLPVTDELSQCGVNLPTYSQLSFEEIEFISKIIRTFHRQ